jgi:Mg2+ and Co2+ transporter CorA
LDKSEYLGKLMLADDSLLFIDANKYLDLYRIDKGKKLLAPLGEQVDYIFVTQQVFSEVQRNKILVAAEFLRQKSKELKLQTFNLPDHLSSTSIDHRNDILQQMSEIAQKIKNINAEIDALVLGIMEQISRSEDEVSKALSPIFAKSVLHSPQELQRARDRRELGNPPGKSTNPIGDQLTWEQILTQFEGKKRLWIISRDGDYGTVYNGKGFLNRFLYDELCNIASEPEVYLFEDIVEGLRHFVDKTGVKAEQRLTPEEVEEIEKEEKSLPSLNKVNEEIRRTLNKSNEELSRMMANLAKPNEELSRMMADLAKPNKEIRRMMADLAKPNEELSRMLNKSNEELSRMMANLAKPNEELMMAEYFRSPTSTPQFLIEDQYKKDEQPTSPPSSQKNISKEED